MKSVPKIQKSEIQMYGEMEKASVTEKIEKIQNSAERIKKNHDEEKSG
jgi:hypothetical protein